MTLITMSFEMDREENEQCEKVFAQYGLDWDTATHAFFNECIRLRKLPFEVTPEMLKEAELSPIKLISEQVVAADAMREISDSPSAVRRDMTDEEMDYRFGEITKLAIEETKLTGAPVAYYDKVLRKAYLEYADGTREYRDD